MYKFSYASSQDKLVSKLVFIRQGESETLAEYVTRFC